MPWYKPKSYPPFWEDYRLHFKDRQEQDISKIRFVVFDTETTGLDIKKDRILSIGAIGIQHNRIKISDQLETYITQEQFNSNTVKIHGLLKGGTLEKATEALAIEEFLNYIENAVLVAHHAAFDIAMINAALQRLKLPKLKNKVLDTGQLFYKTKLDITKRHFSLDELAQKFNIPLHDRHTASGDAYITGQLFLKLLSHLCVGKNMSLRELLKSNERIGLL